MADYIDATTQLTLQHSANFQPNQSEVQAKENSGFEVSYADIPPGSSATTVVLDVDTEVFCEQFKRFLNIYYTMFDLYNNQSFLKSLLDMRDDLKQHLYKEGCLKDPSYKFSLNLDHDNMSFRIDVRLYFEVNKEKVYHQFAADGITTQTTTYSGKSNSSNRKVLGGSLTGGGHGNVKIVGVNGELKVHAENENQGGQENTEGVTSINVKKTWLYKYVHRRIDYSSCIS